MFFKHNKIKNWDKTLLGLERRANLLYLKTAKPRKQKNVETLKDLQEQLDKLSYKLERSLESLVKKKLEGNETLSIKKKAILYWVKEWAIQVDQLYRNGINSLDLHMWIKSLQVKTQGQGAKTEPKIKLSPKDIIYFHTRLMGMKNNKEKSLAQLEKQKVSLKGQYDKVKIAQETLQKKGKRKPIPQTASDFSLNEHIRKLQKRHQQNQQKTLEIEPFPATSKERFTSPKEVEKRPTQDNLLDKKRASGFRSLENAQQ